MKFMRPIRIAASLGFAAGLLLAPEKGKHTRRRIGQLARAMKHTVLGGSKPPAPDTNDLRRLLQQPITGLQQDTQRRLLQMLDEAEELAWNDSRLHTGE